MRVGRTLGTNIDSIIVVRKHRILNLHLVSRDIDDSSSLRQNRIMTRLRFQMTRVTGDHPGTMAKVGGAEGSVLSNGRALENSSFELQL